MKRNSAVPVGLGFIAALDSSDKSSCPADPFSLPKVAGLKGGSDNVLINSLTNLSGMTGTALEDHAMNFYSASPITAIQLTTGITLHLADLLGLVSSRSLLFHPRLVLAPYWQSYRAVTSFFVIGLSTMDVLQRAVGATYYQAPLETLFSGSGDVYRSGKLLHEGKQRKLLVKDSNSPSTTTRRKTLIEWLVLENRFFKAQVLTVGTLVALEFVLDASQPLWDAVTPFRRSAYSDFQFGGSYSGHLVFPYTMFPNLEYATRWLWALTTMEREIVMFGVLPVQPVYLPIVLCGMGGFAHWKALVKGFLATLIVTHIMEVERFDGENVTEWTLRLLRDWYSWTKETVQSVVAVQEPKGKKKASVRNSIGANARRSDYIKETVDLSDPDFHRKFDISERTVEAATSSSSKP
ncbi:hypothetical protein HK096_001843, partial [Nowakowskiella sp. JEL0078]